MNGAVAFQQGRRVGAGELAVGLLRCLRGQFRIQLREGLSEAAFQQHVAVIRVAPLRPRLPGRNLRPVKDGIPQPLQPGEGGVLDDGFGKGRHVQFSTRRTARTRDAGRLVEEPSSASC